MHYPRRPTAVTIHRTNQPTTASTYPSPPPKKQTKHTHTHNRGYAAVRKRLGQLAQEGQAVPAPAPTTVQKRAERQLAYREKKKQVCFCVCLCGLKEGGGLEIDRPWNEIDRPWNDALIYATQLSPPPPKKNKH